jgi:pyridoxal phosphate enzyme (YggS family)
MSIAKELERIHEELGNKAQLVAVSKTKPVEAIQEAYESGQRIFGENKAQELQHKAQQLPDDIQWHMIGHLQSNKVKYIAPFVSLIHSVDKLSLLKEINKRAIQNKRTIDVLLQIHIAQESSKFGLNKQEAIELLQSEEFASYKNIRIVGLMGMATNTENSELICSEFKSLKDLFEELKSRFFSEVPSFKELSMGMSGDYPIALQEGASLIRIGSAIFGARN